MAWDVPMADGEGDDAAEAEFVTITVTRDP